MPSMDLLRVSEPATIFKDARTFNQLQHRRYLYASSLLKVFLSASVYVSFTSTCPSNSSPINLNVVEGNDFPTLMLTKLKRSSVSNCVTTASG
jgi:hypothetical protein